MHHVIRQAVVADAAQVASFAARTFAEAFAADNTAEDMSAYLAGAYGEAIQRRELSDRDITTLVAEADGTLVAFAMLRRNGPLPECVTLAQPVELWRFYVDRPFHGGGLASTLMTECLEAARQLSGRSIWLSVWQHNPRAIAFYRKCGFIEVGVKDFVLGSDRQTDLVVARAL